MYALIYDGRVVQVEPEPFAVHPSLVWVDCPDGVAVEWLWDGVEFRPPAGQAEGL